MKRDVWYELVFPSVVFVLVLSLLVAAAVSAKEVNFPVTQENCGSFGNVIHALQEMRNSDMDVGTAKKMLKDASDNCIKTNGEKNCILQDKEGQEMMDKMIDFIWSHPPVDADSFGMDVYTHCLEANKGKAM